MILNEEAYNDYIGARRSILDVFLRCPHPDIEFDLTRSKETFKRYGIMTYLLDTCILSKLRRMSKYPDPKLRTRIEQHPASLYYVSVFSIAEIQGGIAKIPNEPADRKKYKSDLEDWLFNDLVPDFEGRIIDFDLKIAHRWGSLVGEFKQKGINFPIIDSGHLA